MALLNYSCSGSLNFVKKIPPPLALPLEGGGEGGGDFFCLRLCRAAHRDSSPRMECCPVRLRSFICAEYSRGRDYRLVTDSPKNGLQGAGLAECGMRIADCGLKKPCRLQSRGQGVGCRVSEENSVECSGSSSRLAGSDFLPSIKLCFVNFGRC